MGRGRDCSVVPAYISSKQNNCACQQFEQTVLRAIRSSASGLHKYDQLVGLFLTDDSGQLSEWEQVLICFQTESKRSSFSPS